MKNQTHNVLTPVTALTAIPVLIQVSTSATSVSMQSELELPFVPNSCNILKFKADCKGGVAMKAGAIPAASTLV